MQSTSRGEWLKSISYCLVSRETTPKPVATAYPISKAKSAVPSPIRPPQAQPARRTETSIAVLTRPTGIPVLLCREVIQPSRGPGPRAQVM